MASIFSKIIARELPGRFIWKDERAVAFLTIAPLVPGHALVVPKDEVSEWTDLSEGLSSHLMVVAQRIGKASKAAYSASRAGLIIAGFEVDHVHLHVFPTNSMDDFDFAAVDQNPPSDRLDEDAQKLRQQLRENGWAEFVPEA